MKQVSDSPAILFCMDVDGTLTDGHIYMGAQGEVFKAFDIKDGQGIRLLQENGIVPVIITARVSKIVENRAAELGIAEVYQGEKDKVRVMERLVEKYKTTAENVIYIGDDLGDLPAIRYAGYSYCPSDAVEQIRESVDCVCLACGGRGAVREAVERAIESMGGLRR